eukprot:UN02900
MSWFNEMIRVAWSAFAEFVLVLFLVLIAFGICGWVVFGGHLFAFRTPNQAVANMFQYLITVPDYDPIKNSDHQFGHGFVLVWNLLVTLVLLNVFVAIMINAFETSRGKQSSPTGYFTKIVNETMQDILEFLGVRRERDDDMEKRDEQKIRDQMKVMLQTKETWVRSYRTGAPKHIVTKAISNLYGDCVDKQLVDEIFELNR